MARRKELFATLAAEDHLTFEDVAFVDDWDVYHMALGEVHCGSQVQRAPNEDWWETSLDQLEGN